MSEESKIDDPATAQKAADEVLNESKATTNTAQVESDNEDEQDETAAAGTPASGAATKKKKKSKKKRIKDALKGKSSEDAGAPKEKISKAVSGLSKTQIEDLLKMNPALAQELGGERDLGEAMKRLNLEDIMTGLAANGKNVKDMASYKFWQTQPVPKFGENAQIEEGPFKIIDPEQVPKEPGPMAEGYEWVTMDLTDDAEIKEVYELLNGHYVEDNEAMFRFNYSKEFFKWALLAPGWTKEWHVGVRATTSRKLVAFISAVPMAIRVRNKVLKSSEVNFLCVHKKLRSKRLTPVLIKEVTRRCYVHGVYQAIYTAGIVLPTPVSTCRYFHRSLEWQKLNDVGFSPLPANSKPTYQIRKYQLPDHTVTKGLRPMEMKDVDAVLDLLQRYLMKFDIAPVFTKEEIIHWMLHKKGGEQVVWAYVVENPSTKAVTDFFSFYHIESTVIKSAKHSSIRAAYLFYYASTVALSDSDAPSSSTTSSSSSAPTTTWKERLNALMYDALILAKKHKFDVFNALTLLDNTLFLEQQKFGAGDGQLHFYLYNYKANPIAGGVNKKNEIDDRGSGVGVVML